MKQPFCFYIIIIIKLLYYTVGCTSGLLSTALDFFCQKKKMINKTISINGKVNIFDRVSCPAANSNCEPVKPAAACSDVEISIHLPIIGWKIEVESIPTPPTIDIPKAPLKGTRCATAPIIVGQK